mmetsp:Transcript_16782/g.54157  ORF Transcript_16782/g.54157 Transcript_16782/m.54157 type:complete len:134 (+) Transcript_16782:119-520(+)
MERQFSTVCEENKLTATQTTINIVNLIVGAGILTVPYAFRAGGWVVLPIVVVLVLIFTFTGVLIVWCIQKIESDLTVLEDTGQRDFAFLARKAFGQVGQRIIGACFAVELGMYSAYYLILIATNMPRCSNPWV